MKHTYERVCLWLAQKMPAQLRMQVVVDSTLAARRMHPDPSGYDGPDGLGYAEIYDGAMRTKDAAEEARARRPVDAVSEMEQIVATNRRLTGLPPQDAAEEER